MYKEIQADVRNLHSQLTKLKKEFRNNTDELERISKASVAEQQNYQKRLRQEKELALQKVTEESTKDIKEEIVKTKKKLQSLEETHKNNLANLNEEDVLDDFRDERELHNEVKQAIEDTNNRLTMHVGNRLKNEILSQLEEQKVELTQEELDSFIHYFNDVNEKLDKMYNGTLSKIYVKIENVFNVLKEKRLTENDLNKVILCSLCGILGYLFAKFVMPFYVAALVIFFLYNVYRSYRLYETILVLKAVQDNLQTIEMHLEQMISDELQERVNAENDQYNSMYEKLKETLSNLEVKLDEAVLTCKENFVFSNKQIENDLAICKQSSEDEVTRLEVRNAELKQQITELTNEIIAKNNTLDSVLDELPKQLLNPDKIGKSKLFDCKFLIDVDGGKPIYFEHPKRTALFLYEDENELNNFVKLIVYQLRANINPYNFNVTIVDKKHLGNDFQGFTTSKYPALFRIITSDNAVNDMLEEMRLLLVKRVSNIKSTFSNIEEYNKSMILSESVTESYQFIFYLDMDGNTANNEVFQQLMFAGSDVGFYFHAFAKKESFYKDTSTSLQFLNKVGAVYLLEKGKITTKSRDFIKDNIKQASNKKPI